MLGLLLILFNYPKKLFLHWAISACVLLPLCELCNLIKPHLREKLIKKLSSSDHQGVSPPRLMKRSNISYYKCVGQKLSPQDKLMLSIQSHDSDSKPTTENVLLKTQNDRFLFQLYPLSAYHHVLISSFIIHIFLHLLTAGDCQNMSYTAVKNIYNISTSFE